MTHHVLDQLSSWVEGDLAAAEMAAVDRHLAECPACRAAAEALHTSQAWLREALASPFDAGDREAFHRRVMDRIRAEAQAAPVRQLNPRLALLAASAAVLLVATLIWRREQPLAPRMPAPTVAFQPQADPVPETSPHLAREVPAQAVPRPTPSRRASAPADSPPEGPARIEFQTADPTIRIIWLAQAKPLPEANPPIQEAP